MLIARDSTERLIHPLLVLPCLGLTLFFGPAGLLLYLILREAVGRAAASETRK